ncbi:ecto-ADP-ribosyltransferase 4-like [Brachyistius frenatus]|uniref:ecto-ADP-ribosyltransferase 4-like n=1 Tax=Brachyistius frenatus TaxID=100188 RepID=UPI0037E77F32
MMKSNTLRFAPLWLLLSWMLPAGSKKISSNVTLQDVNQAIPLSMEMGAVDDMYSNCNAKMAIMVKNKYFTKELEGVFRDVWQKAKKCASGKYETREDAALTMNHLQAICVYTSGYKNLYNLFNIAVRTKKNVYGTTFQYHSLHFWLTSAIQILQNKAGCHNTYRRTNNVFKGEVDQLIRFGSFTSTSKLSNLNHFGTKTCFKITTCYGAFLKKYPHLKDREQEVLIPPYETFQITKKDEVTQNDCEVVYVLHSVGYISLLNCQLAN